MSFFNRHNLILLLFILFFTFGCTAPQEPVAVDMRLESLPGGDVVITAWPGQQTDVRGIIVDNKTDRAISIDTSEILRLAEALWPSGQGYFPPVIILGSSDQEFYVDPANGCDTNASNEHFVSCLVAYRLDYDRSIQPARGAQEIVSSLVSGVAYQPSTTTDGQIVKAVADILPRLYKIVVE